MPMVEYPENFGTLSEYAKALEAERASVIEILFKVPAVRRNPEGDFFPGESADRSVDRNEIGRIVRLYDEVDVAVGIEEDFEEIGIREVGRCRIGVAGFQLDEPVDRKVVARIGEPGVTSRFPRRRRGVRGIRLARSAV
jgi:hypothetical protein